MGVCVSLVHCKQAASVESLPSAGKTATPVRKRAKSPPPSLDASYEEQVPEEHEYSPKPGTPSKVT